MYRLGSARKETYVPICKHDDEQRLLHFSYLRGPLKDILPKDLSINHRAELGESLPFVVVELLHASCFELGVPGVSVEKLDRGKTARLCKLVNVANLGESYFQRFDTFAVLIVLH